MSDLSTTQNRDTSNRVKRIYLVRHGQTKANAKEFVPSKEEPLNELGLQQAELLALRVANLDVQKLVVSDFIRAQQTIAPIVALKGLVPEIVPAFGEMLEPSSLHGVSELEERVLLYRKERNHNVENSAWVFEDGESYHGIQTRINQARAFLEAQEEENILVVAHAFFIQCFTASTLLQTTVPTKEMLSVATTFRMSNTGISLLTIEDNKWRVVMHNDHAHFAE